MTSALADKQDAIADLATIRSGASAGATAVQPATTLAGYGINDGYTKAEGQALETQVTAAIGSVQNTVESLNGNEVVVVADHNAVNNPDGQKIYREQGSNSYTDWMYQDSKWKKIATYDMPGFENTPTKNSSKLVYSDGVFKAIQDDAVFDVSAHNLDLNQNPTPYESLALALAAIPTDYRKGGMSIKFIQLTPAIYSVVKTEGLTEQPTGTEVQSASAVVSGTYNASQLSDFSTLPTALNSSLTYYLAVTETVDEQEVTTYTSWVITCVQTFDNKYVQCRLLSDTFSTTDNSRSTL
jgi:hypothetical protein